MFEIEDWKTEYLADDEKVLWASAEPTQQPLPDAVFAFLYTTAAWLAVIIGIPSSIFYWYGNSADDLLTFGIAVAVITVINIGFTLREFPKYHYIVTNRRAVMTPTAWRFGNASIKLRPGIEILRINQPKGRVRLVFSPSSRNRPSLLRRLLLLTPVRFDYLSPEDARLVAGLVYGGSP